MAESLEDLERMILAKLDKEPAPEVRELLLPILIQMRKNKKIFMPRHQEGAASSSGQAGAGAGAGVAAEGNVGQAEDALMVEASQQFPEFGPRPNEAAGSRFGTSSKGTGLEGLNGRSYRTERTGMVAAAWSLVEERGYGFIKAPPFSGKTAFVQQVLNLAERQGWRAFYFNASEHRHYKLDAALRHACGGTLDDLMRGATNCKLLLGVDEAQLLYAVIDSGSQGFFDSIKSLGRDPARYNVRVLVAAAYGAGRSHEDQKTPSPKATPLDLETSATISIAPGVVSLRLTPEDSHELFESWEQRFDKHLSNLVQNRIAELCASQVGLMVFCLDFLAQRLTNMSPDTYPKAALCLLASATFYNHLSEVRSLKHLPPPDLMTFLYRLLWDEVLFADELGKNARLLTSYGQAYVDPSGRLQLTSPLHKASLMRHIYLPGPTSLKIQPQSAMGDVVSAIVKRMDPKVLQRTCSIGANGLPLEYCWQAEVYRVTGGLLTGGAAISPEVSQALEAKGIIDFYISDPYFIGLELTREGNKVTEHLQRFLNPGRYAPLLESGAIKHHAVLDFHSPPASGAHRVPRIQTEHLWTVQFDAGFVSATILHQGAAESVQVRGTASNDFMDVINTVLPAPSTAQ